MNTIPAKTILSGYSDGNGWFGNNYNMNLYKGCCHGCIYCDSRSECYQIENFDTVRVKENALQILEDELSRKKKTGVVGNGAMSDPYNPFEKEMKVTRGALELLDKYRFGASVITKSASVTRDIDILKRIKTHSPVLVKITITTPRDDLAAIVEPNVSTPSQRFEALRELSDSGIYCGSLLMPCLPFIEDNPDDVREIVRKTAEAGGKFVFPQFGVTLRQNQREHFYNKLDEYFPGMKAKYVCEFGNDYECYCPQWRELFAILVEECERYRLVYDQTDIRREYKAGYYDEEEQLTLF